MNIQYSNVRKSHMVAAQLIVNSICFDSLQDYYIVDENVQFRTLCNMIESIAKLETPNYFSIDKSNADGIKDWLMGLPSVITIPFSYYDIYQWGYANGLLSENDSDDKHEKFSNDYWYKVALIIAQYSVKCRRDLIAA